MKGGIDGPVERFVVDEIRAVEEAARPRLAEAEQRFLVVDALGAQRVDGAVLVVVDLELLDHPRDRVVGAEEFPRGLAQDALRARDVVEEGPVQIEDDLGDGARLERGVERGADPAGNLGGRCGVLILRHAVSSRWVGEANG